MINNLLALTQRRLERTLQAQSKLLSTIKELERQCLNIKKRIEILFVQIKSHEKSEELNRMAFWERQRLKAAVLADIAQFEYQVETIAAELLKHEVLKKQIAARTFTLRNKCEKFQKYLKQQGTARCLKLERQQQNEIEELFVHVGNKINIK
ncbi:hypothetical protein [Providencia heimbachae]|uniref:Uncharacterized protein n=1 Tax=Providencia heimbachae ATCC 35613 TaxID=1354272 RepID=A0A1B7JU12_9GAMM|nr:hypothetical protein [Providencia heimbachae]OAT51375.1 hypothetical protein M998_2312 [Providencia heimbachae ATCC 35613]SQH11539.1 Uncharacterised protein [Providencia heimbachae]